MLKFVVLFCAVSSVLGAALPDGMLPQLEGRIVGGQSTTINKFPWQISLQRSGMHSCGGSIYNPQIIVTAAHCLGYSSESNLKIRAGSSYWNSGGDLVSVAAFKKHEGWNSMTIVNDIAVLRLSSPLVMSSTIKSIPLATIAPENGAPAFVSGWGKVSRNSDQIPDQLKYVDVKIVGTSECASSIYGYGSDIKYSMICAYAKNEGTCQDDSGGPLVSGGVLAGVVSWGKGCAVENYPDVYADVAALRSWVISAASSV